VVAPPAADQPQRAAGPWGETPGG